MVLDEPSLDFFSDSDPLLAAEEALSDADDAVELAAPTGSVHTAIRRAVQARGVLIDFMELRGSGCARGDAAGHLAHAALLEQLTTLKRELVTWVTTEPGSAALCAKVERAISAAGSDVIHTRYPAQVLAHTLEGFPNWCSSAPRVGSGFQLPLLLTYATGLLLHHVAGKPYPFLNAGAPGRPQGLYAVEPHLGRGTWGAKFESVLLVDGDETRWLDPELFGEVVG